MKKLIGYEIDDMLRLANLQRRRSAVELFVPAIGFLALGAALGVGVGLMLAPTSGRRLRQDVTERVDQFRHRISKDKQNHDDIDSASASNHQSP